MATNAKFQLNISKFMPDRPKNTGTRGVNTTIVAQDFDRLPSKRLKTFSCKRTHVFKSKMKILIRTPDDQNVLKPSIYLIYPADEHFSHLLPKMTRHEHALEDCHFRYNLALRRDCFVASFGLSRWLLKYLSNLVLTSIFSFEPLSLYSRFFPSLNLFPQRIFISGVITRKCH